MVNSGDVNPNLDYFPLSIDYEEKFYAAGKISNSRFIKREGKPSDEAVLVGRLSTDQFDHYFLKATATSVKLSRRFCRWIQRFALMPWRCWRLRQL